MRVTDPDGNGIEVYVDVSDAWRRDPQRIAQVLPLELQSPGLARSIPSRYALRCSGLRNSVTRSWRSRSLERRVERRKLNLDEPRQYHGVAVERPGAAVARSNCAWPCPLNWWFWVRRAAPSARLPGIPSSPSPRHPNGVVRLASVSAIGVTPPAKCGGLPFGTHRARETRGARAARDPGNRRDTSCIGARHLVP